MVVREDCVKTQSYCYRAIINLLCLSYRVREREKTEQTFDDIDDDDSSNLIYSESLPTSIHMLRKPWCEYLSIFFTFFRIVTSSLHIYMRE